MDLWLTKLSFASKSFDRHFEERQTRIEKKLVKNLTG